MYKFKNIFIGFDELKSSHVTFGDTFKILVKDKDKLILICLRNERHQFIHTYNICQTWKNNILNSGQLLESVW